MGLSRSTFLQIFSGAGMSPPFNSSISGSYSLPTEKNMDKERLGNCQRVVLIDF